LIWREGQRFDPKTQGQPHRGRRHPRIAAPVTVLQHRGRGVPRHFRGTMIMIRRPSPRLLAIAIAALLPCTVFAQSAAAQPDAQPADNQQQQNQQPVTDEPVTLDAVQVTADRRIENIQDVPMAITAVHGEKLQVLTAGGDDIRLLSGRLPSLNIESSYGRSFPRFYVRGLGESAAQRQREGDGKGKALRQERARRHGAESGHCDFPRMRRPCRARDVAAL
jgi:hypothetical protein